MFGLFLGDTDFSKIVLNSVKKSKKNILSLIFLEIINLQKKKILTELVLENLEKL